MSTESRRNLILEELNLHNTVRIADLSKKLNASLVTVRKDLESLEREGLLERVRGGAVKDYRAMQNQAFYERMGIKREEKERIASAAAKVVQDGESVMLNVGSTTCLFAQQLKKKRDLIIFTNAIPIFNELGYCKNLSTVLLGGKFDPDLQHTYGEDVVEQLAKYKVDKVFLGVDGVDPHAGVTTHDHVAYDICKQMISCAKQRIIIADDSKIGNAALVHVASLTEIDMIITSRNSEKEPLLKEIESIGVQVLSV